MINWQRAMEDLISKTAAKGKRKNDHMQLLIQRVIYVLQSITRPELSLHWVAPQSIEQGYYHPLHLSCRRSFSPRMAPPTDSAAVNKRKEAAREVIDTLYEMATLLVR